MNNPEERFELVVTRILTVPNPNKGGDMQYSQSRDERDTIDLQSQWKDSDVLRTIVWLVLFLVILVGAQIVFNL